MKINRRKLIVAALLCWLAGGVLVDTTTFVATSFALISIGIILLFLGVIALD